MIGLELVKMDGWMEYKIFIAVRIYLAYKGMNALTVIHTKAK